MRSTSDDITRPGHRQPASQGIAGSRAHPSDADKASVGRINLYTGESYPDGLREIGDVFSRPAVRSGSIDPFASSARGKRGASLVDAEFLKEIGGWRATWPCHAWLSSDELNDAVQSTIDRLIFLRAAKDRGIEEYGRLQRLAQTSKVYLVS